MASLIKRGTTYYAQYMVGQKAKRISLDTSSVQLAKEKLRQLESSLYAPPFSVGLLGSDRDNLL